MLRLLIGENLYAVRTRLDEFKSEYKSRFPESDIHQSDAADITAADLNNMLLNTSLFNTRNLVVIKNIDDNKEISEQLPDILGNLPDDIELILVSPKPDKRTRWYKAATKVAQVEVYDEKNEKELAGWAVEYAKNLGANLRQTDALYLISRAGLNQSLISKELDKLASYDPSITKENIELLVEKTLEESVFDLIDTVVKGKARRAQAMYDQLRLTEIDAYKFIGLMSWQLHSLLLVKANERTAVAKLAAQSGMAPFVINKSRKIASNLTLRQIQLMIALAIKTDTSIKQTRADVDSQIRLLIDKVGLLASN